MSHKSFFTNKSFFFWNCPENITLKKKRNFNFSKNQNGLIDNFLKNLVILRHQFIEIVIVISVVIILILCIFLKEISKIQKFWRTSISTSSSVVTWFFDSETSSKEVYPNLRTVLNIFVLLRVTKLFEKMKWSMSPETRWKKKKKLSRLQITIHHDITQIVDTTRRQRVEKRKIKDRTK